MTDKTATARSARRNALIRIIEEITGRNPNTALIGVVAPYPFFEYDPATVRKYIMDELDSMKHFAKSAPDSSCRKIAKVMQEHPRKERKRKK